MASEFKKLTVDADNGTFTFEVVDGEAREAAKKAKATAEAIKIPTALPNPKKLKFTGGATGTYDGSQEVTIEIPAGGGGGTVTNDQIAQAVAAYLSENPVQTGPLASIGTVSLPSANWVGSANLYSQVVDIDGVTENSQVDITPSVEQLVIFYEKDLTFVTENDGGVVTVYAIGQKPENDYTIQVTITEVSV